MDLPFGGSQRCFVIAEIGANHNGDLDLCLQSIDAAVETGADAVKLQYYTAAELVADVDRVWSWGPPGKQTSEKVGPMFDRLALSKDELAHAYRHAADRGVPIFCTPFSVQGVADLEDIGNPIYKVASSDLCFHPMLDAIAATKKPVILSTGKAPMEDVRFALDRFEGYPPEAVALLHCIAQYPAPLEEMNIRVVASFADTFAGHPIGLSDHCTLNEPAWAAVALGACIVEKHFTLDNDLHGPDHWFSLNPARFTELVQGVRRVEASLGDGAKRIMACEEWEATYSRRSVIAARDIAAGQVVGADDITLLRPGTGIHPSKSAEVVGKKAVRDLAAGTPVTWEALD